MGVTRIGLATLTRRSMRRCGVTHISPQNLTPPSFTATIEDAVWVSKSPTSGCCGFGSHPVAKLTIVHKFNV